MLYYLVCWVYNLFVVFYVYIIWCDIGVCCIRCAICNVYIICCAICVYLFFKCVLLVVYILFVLCVIYILMVALLESSKLINNLTKYDYTPHIVAGFGTGMYYAVSLQYIMYRFKARIVYLIV